MLNRLTGWLERCQQRPALERWLLAGLVFVVSLLLRLAMDDLLPRGFPFLTFFPAILLAAVLGGIGPGAAVGAAAGVAAWYCFMEPYFSVKLTGASALALGFFGLVTLVDLVLIHVTHLAMRRLRAAAVLEAGQRALSDQLAQTRAVMLQELQHRVSNHLHVLAAMMLLQRNAIRDPEARRVIDAAATRLELIGRIQRQLHSVDGVPVPFGHVLQGLCSDLLRASGSAGVEAAVEADPVVLSPEQIVPVALIVAELLANAVEHGFGAQRGGRIAIRLTCAAQRVQLTVQDDGAGLAPDFVLEHTRSLGLRIVQALARQLGGAFTMRPAAAAGTACQLDFALA